MFTYHPPRGGGLLIGIVGVTAYYAFIFTRLATMRSRNDVSRHNDFHEWYWQAEFAAARQKPNKFGSALA